MAGPRIRTLKPEILEDEKTAPLSDTAFRLFTSLVVLADDWGNVRCDERLLSAQIWWAHVRKPDVLSTLVELCKATLIEVYAVRGGTYAHLRGWEKHQRIDNAGKGRVPKPDDPDALVIVADELFAEHLAASRRESPRTAAGSGPGMGSGREGDRDREPAAKTPRGNPRGKRLPADWQPRAEEQESARAKGLDCDSEMSHFRDHHTAKGTTMVDWDAAFRTWLKNAVKFGRGRQQQKTPLELQLERVRMLEEQERKGETE